MPPEAENQKSFGQETFTVDAFQPEDAEGLVRLFKAVYGDGYPIRLFYDAEAIRQANAEGRYITIVGRTPSGEVVGANHLYRSAPYRGLYESGVGLVHKDYRAGGILTAILKYMYDGFVPGKPYMEELFGEAVCNHIISQKLVVPFRHVETALEVALMPAEAYTREQSASGRVATLDAFRCYVPKPHRVFLPEVYAAILRRIYARLDDERDLAPSVPDVPAEAETRAELTVFDFARVARIAVSRSGADFVSRLTTLEDEAEARHVVVFQVWLNLTEPWVAQIVDALRRHGYFLGGVLPRWFDGDGLLMQKIRCEPDFDKIMLLSAFAKDLLTEIRADHAKVS